MCVPRIPVKMVRHAFLVRQAFIANVPVAGRELHVEYVNYFFFNVWDILFLKIQGNKKKLQQTSMSVVIRVWMAMTYFMKT